MTREAKTFIDCWIKFRFTVKQRKCTPTANADLQNHEHFWNHLAELSHYDPVLIQNLQNIHRHWILDNFHYIAALDKTVAQIHKVNIPERT